MQLQVHAEQLTTTAVAAEAAVAAVDIARVASSTGPHPAASVGGLPVPGSSVVSPPLLAAAPGMQVRLWSACRMVVGQWLIRCRHVWLRGSI
jgi:hypothetical protein